MCTPNRDPPGGEWPHQLWSSSHCWHLLGADNCLLALACCSCAYSIVIEGPHHEWLRYSLMVGGERVAQGRGYLVGNCESGSRRLAPTGEWDGSCEFSFGGFGMIAEGLASWPIATTKGDSK